MTIKELYELAKSKDMEKAEIVISHECSDDWYSIEKRRIDSDDICFFISGGKYAEIYVED